MYIERGEAAQD